MGIFVGETPTAPAVHLRPSGIELAKCCSILTSNHFRHPSSFVHSEITQIYWLRREMEGLNYLQRLITKQSNSYGRTEMVATDFIVVNNPILICQKRCTAKRLAAIFNSNADCECISSKEVTACMVCEKYFTRMKSGEDCWSCGHTMCSTCSFNKGTNEDDSVRNIVVCLHCNYGKGFDHCSEDSNCKCLFCQPSSVGDDPHIVLEMTLLVCKALLETFIYFQTIVLFTLHTVLNDHQHIT